MALMGVDVGELAGHSIGRMDISGKFWKNLGCDEWTYGR